MAGINHIDSKINAIGLLSALVGVSFLCKKEWLLEEELFKEKTTGLRVTIANVNLLNCIVGEDQLCLPVDTMRIN